MCAEGRGLFVYRLIWFQHVHKAAGTLVVNLAKENGEVLFKNNANGNPLDENGDRLELWNYSAEELTDFLDQCEKDGVTFVATEHGSPDFRLLSEDSRVTPIQQQFTFNCKPLNSKPIWMVHNTVRTPLN